MKRSRCIKSILVFILILITFSGLFSLSVAAEESENLIKFGDFEGDLQAVENAWNSRKNGIVVEGVSFGDGNRAGAVPYTALSGDFADGFIGQIVNVQPYTTYRVSAMVKVDVEGAVGDLYRQMVAWYKTGRYY